MRKTMLDRFEEKYSRGGADECWEWSAGLCRYGYGRFRVDGEKVGAHRASYSLYVGPVPAGAMVLHSCDNRKCVNPAHLRIGTAKDNAMDAASRARTLKGRKVPESRRSYVGENGPRAKLTREQAQRILADPRTVREIAADYGITYGAVGHLKRGMTWANIQRESDGHSTTQAWGMHELSGRTEAQDGPRCFQVRT